MSRKVTINLTLVGRTYRNAKELEEFSKLEIFLGIQEQIKDQFGERAILMSDEDSVTFGKSKYPEFYAAGWFISDQPTLDNEGAGSELVVVAHGNSMEVAKEAMMKSVAYANWDELAANI